MQLLLRWRGRLAGDSCAPRIPSCSWDAVVEAFNVNDLDAVMTFFHGAAVYRPGDGKEHHGKAAIRGTFEPQFSGAYAEMRFDEIDRLLDSKSRKAAFRVHDWEGGEICRCSPIILPLFGSAR